MDHSGVFNGIVMISEGACRFSVVWWNYTAMLWLKSGLKPGTRVTVVLTALFVWFWWPGDILSHKRGHHQTQTSNPSFVSQSSHVPCWQWQWSCRSKINTWVLMVCSISLQPNPLCRASVCFYSKHLCVLVTFSPYVCEGPSPLKAITISPHHAVPSSSQTRHDRHINTPSHPIEHSIQKEEGNAMNVEECNHLKELD